MRVVRVRLQNELLSLADRERKLARLTRAAVINEALRLWVDQRQHDAAIRRDQHGYRRHPVAKNEFASVLGAQTLPAAR